MRAIVFIVFSRILTAQTWGPDEVHSKNWLYQPPSPITLSVQSNLVEVGVVVRDSRGHAVAGLQRSDFRIFDDGKERELSAFSVESVAGRAATDVPTTNSSPIASVKAAAEQRSVILFFDDFSIA